MIGIAAVRQVLQQYSDRYRFLDVFQTDVHDLALVPWTPVADAWISPGNPPLRMQRVTDDVIRFSLAATAPDQAPLVGAALGAALGAAGKKEGGVLIGLGLGLLIGALVAGNPQMNRVMTLRYSLQGGWRVYDGPLRRVAKQALAPG